MFCVRRHGLAVGYFGAAVFSETIRAGFVAGFD
jgi:hypothetical protein